MFRKLGLLVVMLTVILAFGQVGLAQSDPDADLDESVPYPSAVEETESRPQFVYCRWETLTVGCTPWEKTGETYRCNMTHRCIGGTWKGCYHISKFERKCTYYQRQCCYSWPSGDLIGCGPWQGPYTRTETKETRTFLGCNCLYATPTGCVYQR